MKFCEHPQWFLKEVFDLVRKGQEDLVDNGRVKKLYQSGRIYVDSSFSSYDKLNALQQVLREMSGTDDLYINSWLKNRNQSIEADFSAGFAIPSANFGVFEERLNQARWCEKLQDIGIVQLDCASLSQPISGLHIPNLYETERRTNEAIFKQQLKAAWRAGRVQDVSHFTQLYLRDPEAFNHNQHAQQVRALSLVVV